MATIVVTNISSDPVGIGDLYKTLAPGEAVTTSRATSDLEGMAGLQAALADGLVTLAVTYTADEIASGLQQAPSAVEAQDMAPVAAAVIAGSLTVMRIPLVAAIGGTADDVTGLAVGALPFKFRVVDAIALVSVASGGSTLTVRTRAGAGGTVLATCASASTGRNPNAANATAVAIPGATEGLFVRRSDNTVAGEVLLFCRPES